MHLSVHGACEVPRNCQPESDSWITPGIALLHLKKGLEYVRDHITGDSYARVTHSDADEILIRLSANLDATSVGGKLDCVREEVEQNLPQLFRIGTDRERIIAWLT